MAFSGVSESFATGLPFTYWSFMTMLSAGSQVSLEQKVPMPKDTFDFKDYHITVERVSRRRVEQINIKKQEPVGQ